MKLYLSKIYSLPCLLAFSKTNIANLPTGSSQYMNISELYGAGGGSICTENDNMDIKREYEYLQGVRA